MSRHKSAQAALEESAAVFAALGDPTRLKLVSTLCANGPLSITRLTDDSHVTRQAVTKHLVALDHAGLVRHRRSGRERIWELEPRRLDIARRHIDQISAGWDRAVGRLRALVEEH